MKYNIRALDHIPDLGKCLAVVSGNSSRKKALEKLEWKISVGHIKFDENKILTCYIYKTEIGYEAALVELSKTKSFEFIKRYKE